LGSAGICSGAAGDFDVPSYKQNTPSTPHWVQAVPDALRGSFLSCSVSSSAGECAILALLSAWNMQRAPFSDRASKINFGFFIILTQKLLDFQSEQCLVVKLKPAVGFEIVAGVQSHNIRAKSR